MGYPLDLVLVDLVVPVGGSWRSLLVVPVGGSVPIVNSNCRCIDNPFSASTATAVEFNAISVVSSSGV